jgi:hypothetical protein
VRSTKGIATAIVVLAPAATLLLSGCSLLFSGGPGNIVRNLKSAPDAESPAIARERLRATEEIEAALAAVDAGSGFTSYATATGDRCYKGENDWKITDGYAHRCTVRTTRFYGMSGDFRAQMLGLEDLLASGGWQPPRSLPDLPPATFREMFATYYDRYCSGNRIAVFGVGVDPLPCEVSKLPRSGSNGYKKGHLVLWIECAERGESDLYMMDLMQRGPRDREPNLYQKTSLQDVAAQVREITASDRYVVAVTIEQTYFEN